MKAATLSLTPRSCRNLSNSSWTPTSSLGLAFAKDETFSVRMGKEETKYRRSNVQILALPVSFGSELSAWETRRGSIQAFVTWLQTNLKDNFRQSVSSRNHQPNVPARDKLWHWTNELMKKTWQSTNQDVPRYLEPLGSVSDLLRYEGSTYLGLGFNKWFPSSQVMYRRQELERCRKEPILVLRVQE